MRRLYVLLILSLITSSSWGQSCCSGGAPLSGNLGLPMTDSKNLQFSASYDLNKLNTLKNGTETLDDNTRTRTTHTVLLQLGYTLNKHLAIEVLVPWVRQERAISPLGLPSTFESTSGIGDIVLLSKYRFFKNYQAGLGVKLPSGKSDKLNTQGLTLSADLQPGSGSWDIIYWFSSQHQIKLRKSMSIHTVATFRATGANENYLGSQRYEFGNEIQGQIGISDQILVFSQILTPSLSFKYRQVKADQNENFEVPSTGGKWLFIKPGIGYAIGSQLNLVATVDLPLYARLEGTQITPTYRFNISVLFNLNL